MKLRITLLAAASGLALVAGLAAPAGASTPPVNVANDHVACTSAVGTFKFLPPLGSGGTSGTAISVKATLGGCTDTDNDNVHLLSGTMATDKLAPLAGASDDCTALLGLSNAPGNLITKWKTIAATIDTPSPKITPAITTLAISNIKGLEFGPVGSWNGNYGEFQVGTTFGTVTPHTVGAAGSNVFSGGDNGHLSTLDSTTSQDIGTLGTQCLVTGGIKSVTLGIGGVAFG